jgi:hypothetical protein
MSFGGLNADVADATVSLVEARSTEALAKVDTRRYSARWCLPPGLTYDSGTPRPPDRHPRSDFQHVWPRLLDV